MTLSRISINIVGTKSKCKHRLHYPGERTILVLGDVRPFTKTCVILDGL